EGPGPRVFWCFWLVLGLAVVAALCVHLMYFFPSNPFLYLQGIARVNADHDPSYMAYMAGRLQPPFLSYYVVPSPCREPLPSSLLAVAGMLAMLGGDARVAAMDRAFLLAPPAALFAFYSVVSHNLGFRYVLPALPYLHLAGGVGAHALWTS